MKFLPFIFISFLTIRDILASFVKIPVVILIAVALDAITLGIIHICQLTTFTGAT